MLYTSLALFLFFVVAITAESFGFYGLDSGPCNGSRIFAVAGLILAVISFPIFLQPRR